eukprot:scaffold20050_cov57-Attheya_sp.AAC.1
MRTYKSEYDDLYLMGSNRKNKPHRLGPSTTDSTESTQLKSIVPSQTQQETSEHQDPKVHVQFLVGARLATAAVVLVGFEGLYRFVLVPNVRSIATVGSGGVCVVASGTVAGTAWFVTDGAGLKQVAKVGTRLATAVAKLVGFEGLY